MNVELHSPFAEDESRGHINNGTAEQADNVSTCTSIAPGQHERWSKLSKPRGRQPRDPEGQIVKSHCHNTDEMENFLRSYIQAPTVPAEHAIIEFTFPISSAFMVFTADLKGPRKSTLEIDEQHHLYGKLDRTAISITDALTSTEDPKESMRRQKAIAKICVETCEKADGFRYSFHNHWLSREDEACRFSYFCNDSTLNKGRAANEGAGMLGKKMRKPVYNCQGLIAVKFSATKQTLEVQYKHIPLHKTYAERAPPPRRDSKRRRMMEVFEPQNLPPRKRKRRGQSTETASPKHALSIPANESPVVNAITDMVNQARKDTLQPLVEFLGSTNETSDNEVNLLDSTTHRQNAVSEPIPPLNLNSTAPTADKASSNRAKRPNIPGITADHVPNGRFSLEAPSLASRNRPSRNTTKNASSRMTLPANSTDTASSSIDAASIALSELESLRRKLEEAEERIKKLEAEKVVASQSLPIMPPQHLLWPAPIPAPSHSPDQSHSLQQPLAGQSHFHEQSQRPFASTSEDPNKTGTNRASGPNQKSSSSNTVRTKLQPSAQKGTQSKPAATRFVLYEPKKKLKQTLQHRKTPSDAMSSSGEAPAAATANLSESDTSEVLTRR